MSTFTYFKLSLTLIYLNAGLVIFELLGKCERLGLSLNVCSWLNVALCWLQEGTARGESLQASDSEDDQETFIFQFVLNKQKVHFLYFNKTCEERDRKFHSQRLNSPINTCSICDREG